MRFKAAVIGCGMIANFAHIPAYRHLPETFEVVGVCDMNKETAKTTAERYGIGVYTDCAEEVLEKAKPDIVSVCVPNMFHAKYIRLALEAGCHVLCEKPLGMNYKETEELFGLAASKGLMLCACQSMRFTPDRLEAKRMTDSGVLGDIYYGEFSRIRRRGIPKWGAFHMEEISGGGAFSDIGVHMLDALVWLMGTPKVEAVSGTAVCRLAKAKDELASGLKESGALAGKLTSERTYKDEEFNVEDFASGSISFEGGKRINFKVAWAANLPDETSIILTGDKCGVKLPDFTFYGGFAGAQADIVPKISEVNPYPKEEFSGHFMLFDKVADYLTEKGEIPVKPEETLAVTAIIDLFYRSAKSGKEMRFDDIG